MLNLVQRGGEKHQGTVCGDKAGSTGLHTQAALGPTPDHLCSHTRTSWMSCYLRSGSRFQWRDPPPRGPGGAACRAAPAPHIHEFGRRPASEREAPAGRGCARPQQLHHGAVLPLPRPATYGGQEGVRQSTFLGKEKETDRLFDMLTECQNTGCSRRERIVREPRGQILTQSSESTRCVKTTLFKTSVKL